MGAKVGLTARKTDELEQAAAHLRGQGADVATFACDLADPGTIPALVDSVLARFGTIDVLVNNAGATWGAPTESHPDEAWRKVMALNVDAPFFLCREVGRRVMIPRRSGKIVVVASVAGLSGGRPDMPTIGYYTSKAAAINFTRALAVEWGRYGINVNAICPGFFPTKMSKGLLEKIGERTVAGTPLGRLGGDEDLKGAIVLLVSEAGRHITGQYLTVDGGHSAGH
jgi:gluconate 5-dehydrogenase